MTLTADQTQLKKDLSELRGQKTLSRMQHRDKNMKERLLEVDTGGEDVAYV